MKWILSVLAIAAAATAAAQNHPRLYFGAADLQTLRADRDTGLRKTIYANLIASADWCLTKTPRAAYIAPAADDPIYENLYDRFYAMMGDMAITEHLAFAYAISGDAKYGDAARLWTLATCRAWRPDAEASPDDSKAYAVCRMLKGVAVAYDILYDGFTDAERAEIRDLLAQTAATYYAGYFTKESIAAPTFHTHHAIVQFGSFGIVALALLGDVPEAQTWLDATVTKYTEHILPHSLADDGAQIEGATFWASTMHYRLFFMDALRRVTGRDLYTEFADVMNADLALASIAAEKQAGWDEPHQTVILEPPYGQLNYYAPVLLALAREYRKPLYQYLAQWDHTLGTIQKTRYITPNTKEQLLFELGGYAYLWYDATVPAEPSEAPLSYAFPSVGQAYLRAGWEPALIVAGIDDDGVVVIHAGGEPVLIAAAPDGLEAESLTLGPLTDDGAVATASLLRGDAPWLTLTLTRPDAIAVTWHALDGPLPVWRYTLADGDDPKIVPGPPAALIVETGTITERIPQGHVIPHAVGNGRLTLFDPAPKTYPRTLLAPEEGMLEVRITPAPPR